jgi:hypothetical protein
LLNRAKLVGFFAIFHFCKKFERRKLACKIYQQFFCLLGVFASRSTSSIGSEFYDRSSRRDLAGTILRHCVSLVSWKYQKPYSENLSYGKCPKPHLGMSQTKEGRISQYFNPPKTSGTSLEQRKKARWAFIVFNDPSTIVKR